MSGSSTQQKIGLDQSLTQRLLPLQVRGGRMLEMNASEIEEEVKRALEELPALEVSDAESNHEPEEHFDETSEQMQLADFGGDEEIPSTFSYARRSPDNEAMAASPGSFAPAGENTMIDSLMRQINEHNLSPDDILIAQYIIGNIDDNGYMSRDLKSIGDDIAIQAGIDVDEKHLRQIRDVVRSLEPAGIGAVDLRDCLLLQLRRKPGSLIVDIAIEMISDYFDLFSKKHFERIASMMGISPEQVKEAMSIIRQLNPKPGSLFEQTPLQQNSTIIIPDFQVETDGQHINLTLLNNIPELCIDATFDEDSAIKTGQQLSRAEKDASTFIKRHRDEAREFIKILRTRQETLFKVMSAIVNIQRDFFLTDDPNQIKPMILKDVSSVTGLDLSVISRASASKYVATQHGVYPLKMFFNESTGGQDNETSSHSVGVALKKLIDNEDKHHPLSDEALTTMMNEQGFELARRTVSKYREKLGLPVARLRKEM
ncbi:MAG: RNA polymerase factor sigma-54 [Muribaculaceae bacterium]|nr:RNA polymerase factor sigma-54 [Muribaculaceae bacterium]